MNAEDTNLAFARLRRWATYASLAVALTLIAAKLWAWFVTDSVAVLSSLLDSTVDLIASAVTAYGVASALRPPDREHRFGHGKAESLAALAQAAFIVGSSVLLCYEALGRFYTPRAVQNSEAGYGVMIFALVLTFALVTFQRAVVRRTNSMAIGADRLHYVGDLAMNLAVMAALGLQQMTGLSWFDPLFAIAIGAGLIVNAVKIVRSALDVLMDHELPEPERLRIASIVKAQKGIEGMHDLRTRSDSDRVFIEFHVEMDPRMTVAVAHEVVDSVMAAIRAEYPQSDIMVHQDPVGLKENRLDERIDSPAPRAGS